MQGGSIIRLFHKELEAFLVAEGLFDDEISEDGPLCYLLSLLTVSTLSSSLKTFIGVFAAIDRCYYRYCPLIEGLLPLVQRGGTWTVTDWHSTCLPVACFECENENATANEERLISLHVLCRIHFMIEPTVTHCVRGLHVVSSAFSLDVLFIVTVL